MFVGRCAWETSSGDKKGRETSANEVTFCAGDGGGGGEAKLPRLAADELMMLVKIPNLSSESCSSGHANRKVMKLYIKT